MRELFVKFQITNKDDIASFTEEIFQFPKKGKTASDIVSEWKTLLVRAGYGKINVVDIKVIGGN